MGSWQRILAALGLLFAFGAGAAELRPGREFTVINPPLAAERNKIEVTEFFWYGCPHCFEFEPIAAAWARKLPADVILRRVPAVFPNNKWAPGAQLYYSLEAMNLADTLHVEAFKAIHVERRRLDDEKAIVDWVAGKGVDARKFRETWVSFGVQTRLRQARELTLAAGLGGVPAVVVQGRYLAINPASYSELPALVDALIERVRAEAGRK